MKNFFEFKDSNNNLRFIASTGEEFMKAFINFNDDQWLEGRLEDGGFERWLKDVGEIEIYNLILDVKNDYRITTTKQKIKKIRLEFRRIKYFEAIDVEPLIEVCLKEYETLRQEILFYMQNRTQIIFLGLTGIFAIAGLVLTPLTEFFTTEEIEINGYNVNIPYLITRAIDGNTINNKAIIPTIFLLAIIIPIASLYVIYRSSQYNENIYKINKYIRNYIEEKINLLTDYQLINPIVYSKINRRVYFRESKLLYWETWINKNRNKGRFHENTALLTVELLFFILGLLSLVGSFILFLWDFNSGKVIPVIQENFPYIKGWKPWLFSICIVIYLYFFFSFFNPQPFSDKKRRKLDKKHKKIIIILLIIILVICIFYWLCGMNT